MQYTMLYNKIVSDYKMDEKYPINNLNDSVLVNLRQTIADNAAKNRIVDETTNTVRLPVIGCLWFVNDRFGQYCLAGVYAYWIYGVWSSYYVILEPHHADGHVPTWFMWCKHTILCFLKKNHNCAMCACWVNLNHHFLLHILLYISIYW